MTTIRTSVVKVLCPVSAFIILLIFFVLTYVLGAAGYVTRRGFYCDDESIRYPFVKRASFPTWALVVYIWSLPLAAIIIGSVLTKYITKADNPFYVKMPLSKCQFSSSILLPVMWYSWYIFGLGLLYSSVEYMKLFTGELRPYFIPVCNPNFSLVNCTQGSQRYPVYVTDYECRGDPKEVVESRMSFPSGHAALSSYAGVFTALYISMVPLFTSRSLFQLLSIVITLLGPVLISLSRIVDNRHHLHDVLFGAALGITFAVFLVCFNLRYFRYKKKSGNLEATESEIERIMPTKDDKGTISSTNTE